MGSGMKAHLQHWDNFGHWHSAMDRAGKNLTLPYLTVRRTPSHEKGRVLRDHHKTRSHAHPTNIPSYTILGQGHVGEGFSFQL